jgi:hypothetical protein
MQMKWYYESLQERKVPQDTEEKALAMAEMLAECEAFEKVLLAEGAKTFKEMHPDIKEGDRSGPSYGYYKLEQSACKNDPYQTAQEVSGT